MEAQNALLSQYLASLRMLEIVIKACPEAMWLDEAYINRFWHVAYHALFYTHLYIQPDLNAFIPWAKHRPEGEHITASGEPYTQKETLEYLQICRDEIRSKLPHLNFEGPSGFYWLKMSKLELQLYSIRHLMQHTGELSERLGSQLGIEVQWISKEPGSE